MWFPVATVTLFLAMLAIMAFTVAALLGITWAFDSDDRLGLLSPIKQWGIGMAATIATVSMMGSLYLSEVANYEPCRLCWIQRGFMYPAALILIAATVTKNRILAVMGGVLALGGLPVALFHRYEQAQGPVGNFCDVAVPCSARWVNEFGFITIPTMAAAGFVSVFMLVAVQLFWRKS